LIWPGPNRFASTAGAIWDRIAIAQAWEHIPFDFAGDETTRTLLDRLDRAIEASHREMETLGIPAVCRACEEVGGGSCCGAGMERIYEPELLFVNRLLGVELPARRRDPGSCFFLGSEGCVLKARHVMCVNYVCDRITAQVPAEGMNRLRAKEGIELETLFFLEERIRTVVSDALSTN